MVSKIGKTFFSELYCTDFDIERIAQKYAYSELITIALDLQFITKTLLAKVEDYTGENLTDVLFEVDEDEFYKN